MFSLHYSFRYSSFSFLEEFPLNILARYFLLWYLVDAQSGWISWKQSY